MRSKYDFPKARKNPYSASLKRDVKLRLDTETIGYFKSMSVQTGISYLTLINHYMGECAAGKRKPKWA